MALILDRLGLSLHGRPLIKPFSLTVATGEIVTLMGPSGSGKSSLLSSIAGDLDPPFSAEGSVLLDGRAIDREPPERRRIGRLFQDDLLFPHMSVGENLLFGMPRGEKSSRRKVMAQALRDAGLEGFADRAPHTLSGGQRARVSLMRALVSNPAAMLLDEPFNRLDEELRASIRLFVFDHLIERNIPCMLVTHDRADAPAGGRIFTITAAGEVRDD